MNEVGESMQPNERHARSGAGMRGREPNRTWVTLALFAGKRRRCLSRQQLKILEVIYDSAEYDENVAQTHTSKHPGMLMDIR